MLLLVTFTSILYVHGFAYLKFGAQKIIIYEGLHIKINRISVHACCFWDHTMIWKVPTMKSPCKQDSFESGLRS